MLQVSLAHWKEVCYKAQIQVLANKVCTLDGANSSLERQLRSAKAATESFKLQAIVLLADVSTHSDGLQLESEVSSIDSMHEVISLIKQESVDNALASSFEQKKRSASLTISLMLRWHAHNQYMYGMLAAARAVQIWRANESKISNGGWLRWLPFVDLVAVAAIAFALGCMFSQLIGY